MSVERQEKLRYTRWRKNRTLKEQIIFERERIEKKILNVNNARNLSEVLKMGVAEIAKKAVSEANGTGSFDEKLEHLFNALQEIVDLLGSKEESIDVELSDYESQLKLIEVLLEQDNVDDSVVEESEDQI